ncbi:ABC transporter permease [Spirosoma fluminis]
MPHPLRMTFRAMKRFKTTFLINLVGLSTGLASALMIYLWVHDEWSTDKFHENDNRLFQVFQHIHLGDGTILTGQSTPTPLAAALRATFPQIQDVALTTGGNKGILSRGNSRLKAKGMFVTPNFLAFFSYPLLQGQKQQVLRHKRSVVVSAELALKLFHSTQNILGKTVEWDQGDYSGPYTIAGVFQKPTRHSSADFDLLLPFQLYADQHAEDVQDWGSSNPKLYLLLNQQADADVLNSQVTNFLRTKYEAAKGKESLASVGYLFLKRYSDHYLYNQYEQGVQTGGRIVYVTLFSLIALFILLIAAINFMNLSTAQASTRLKEIGVKKAVGADRTTLLIQFLRESILLAFVALLVALGLVALLLPTFNQVTGKQLGLSLEPTAVASIVGITLLTGLLAGSYPALYLSGFKPVQVLKGTITPSTGEAWARQGLVVFQFTISIILIVAVLVVRQQLDYIQHKDLGYTKENVISFNREGRLQEQSASFLAQVGNLPGIVSASSMGGNLVGGHSSAVAFEWPGKQADQKINFGIFYVNYDLIETMGIAMQQGRSLSPQFGMDSTSSIVFNQAAIDAMGLKNPLGQVVKVKGQARRIVGVTKNFHFESLYEAVKPVCFLYKPDWANELIIRIAAGKESQALSGVEQLYKQYNPGLPLDYKFLDEEYDVLYASEKRVATLSGYFVSIAILISCLGLLGLSTFSAARRRKEIGIRKVLGASVSSLAGLLTKDFLKLVVVAIVIGWPIAWYGMSGWLAHFAYKIDLAWWVFGLAGVLAVVIALLTISYQAIKAALMDPVKSLRSD